MLESAWCGVAPRHLSGWRGSGQPAQVSQGAPASQWRGPGCSEKTVRCLSLFSLTDLVFLEIYSVLGVIFRGEGGEVVVVLVVVLIFEVVQP
ncbi:hypothetical protein E2C01_014511 [Portunus trituberculatus]|uniref:Uncharacterized protein n=1 Tax=Portunus trituberculatus TaxID=210409 RepID=A0A5B7DK73_PORTR|nr:hypothetical protein [Portunus trituberculatus]